jgi:VWFA-related protein
MFPYSKKENPLMGRRFLRLSPVVFFCCFFLFNAQLWAQVKPANAAADVPTFTSRSQLVLVPVLVKGRNGEHMGGLASNVFTVEEQGKRRKVATFEEVKPVAADAKVPVVPQLEGRSNFNFEDAPRGHMTIVVLDLLNTPYLFQGDGKRKLIEQLANTIPAHEATAIFGLGTHGLRQLYAPTTDTAGLLASLQGVRVPIGTSDAGKTSALEALTSTEFNNSFGEMWQGTGVRGGRSGGDLEGATWITLTAMTQLAHAYGTIPGRKTLIWASGGFSGALSPGITRSTMVEKYDATWRELNSADIAVYSLDVSGLAGFNGTLTRYGALQAKQWSLREFADNTGGLWCAGTSVDTAKCLSRAFDDSGSYYLLGYYLPQDDLKPGWRKLKVKVDAAGAKVRARDGFYVSAGADEKADDQRRELLDALRSPVDLTGVRMNVRELPAKSTGSSSRHEFVIGVLGDSIAVDDQRENAVNVSVTAVAFGEDGKEHGRIDHLLEAKVPQELMPKFRKTGLSAQQGMDLTPGKYEIHFAVRDNLTGEIGTVTYLLAVK